MQTVKEKLSDMKEMRKVKAEAKAQEQAEKELSKARVDIAHEVRLAREAEGTMDLHVAKAGQKAEREIAKHTAHQNQPLLQSTTTQSSVEPPNNPYGQNYTDSSAGSTAAAAATTGMGNTTNPAEAPPKNNLVPPNFNIFSSK